MRQCAQGHEQRRGPLAPPSGPGPCSASLSVAVCMGPVRAGQAGKGGRVCPHPTPKLLDPQRSGGPSFSRCPEDLCWACLSLGQWGLATFGAMGTVVFSWEWASRVRPLRPSHEPGLTGEAKAGSGAS